MTKQEPDLATTRRRRTIAKHAVIRTMKHIYGEDGVPDGYSVDDIFATEHHDTKWGWWFYLTAKGSKTTVFKVAYSNARDSYQVTVHPREFLYEFGDISPDTFAQN